MNNPIVSVSMNNPIVIVIEDGLIEGIYTRYGGRIVPPIVVLDYDRDLDPEDDAVVMVPQRYGDSEKAYVSTWPATYTLGPLIADFVDTLIAEEETS